MATKRLNDLSVDGTVIIAEDAYLTWGIGQSSRPYIQGDKTSGYLKLGINGSSAIHINNSQNVGIGTTNPTNKLQVTGNIYATTNIQCAQTFGNKSTNKGINFETPSTGTTTARIDSDRFRLYFGGTDGVGETVSFNENGRVGIGTASPSSLLHISSGTAGDAILILEADTDNNDENDNPKMQFKQDGGNIFADVGLNGNVAPYTGATANAFYIETNDLLELATANVKRMTITNGGDIVFRNTANSDQFYWDASASKLGLGTTTPANKLDIQNNYAYETSVTVHNNPHIRLSEDTGDVYLSNLNHSLYLSTSPPKGAGRSALIDGATKTAEIQLIGTSNGDIRFYTGSGTSGTVIQQTEKVRLSNAGNLGIGTNSPASSAKLTVMGNQTFGLPGSGSNANGRFLSIEGNANSSDGEASGRIFFTEHNSTSASTDKYGMSLGYRGGATSVTGASGNAWTGLSQISNGQWGMWGHDNNADGALIMSGDRAATFVDFQDNTVKGASFYRLNAGNGNGINFWNSTNYSIRMSTSASGGRLDTTSDYNMYFKMTGATNRGFVFCNDTTPKAQIDSTGKLYLEGGIKVNSTDSVELPVGTTAQRPSSPAAGMIRYNSTDGSFEGYTDSWGAIGGGDDFSLKSITKNASNQFPITFADSTNFKLSASGTWTITATIASGDVGKSGIILIVNTAATTPGALPSTFKTPNGDNIVFETDSGDYSVISYFIASTTHVLVNYVGNFS